MRRRSIVKQRTDGQEPTASALFAGVAARDYKPLSHAERGKLAAERAPLCPKCNKSKAFYFHVKNCHG